ncbi:uncharacterized protein ACA1_388690 [Acanthamoeba castellanii str. Neff]|uniref:Uncharacterized protein n=1 Tax=Acanthamoeba castellanii (strain ATCC 30010 / Neff) TaxID=1257118 RepID=L8GEA7_ACACF|nr:uncharacterized protein ACA1_388690 [Acanthamoeba castellanii str. Neff]ELR11179.1 hypothetical protein ACA1_388690 [Acanthamoeba castellanii str. Neff]
MSWVKVTNGQIPPNALVAGYEADGTALYVARAEHEGGQHPGKTSKPLGAIHFGWGGKEVTKSDYEVLCCNPRQLACVHWVKMERGQQMPEKAWIGGKERDGHGLCIARGKVHGGVHVGKAGNHLRDGMMVSYGGEEHTVAPYEVLTFEDRLA